MDAVLLEGDRAVVSFAAGGATSTGAAVRVDLAASTPSEIVSPEPANGGSWAMHDDSLWYPTSARAAPTAWPPWPSPTATARTAGARPSGPASATSRQASTGSA